jgi:hypothetical protein
MQTVGAYEAKTNLSALLEKVSKGETITITRRGEPVAELNRPDSCGGANVTEIIAAIRAHRKNFINAFAGVNIKELLKEGRR